MLKRNPQNSGLGDLGQNHLETNFAETNFPNTKTLIWAFWLTQISVLAFGKLVSAKLISRWFCP